MISEGRILDESFDITKLREWLPNATDSNLITLPLKLNPEVIRYLAKMIRCHRCGRCCQACTDGVYLRSDEIGEIANKLGMRKRRFLRKYTYLKNEKTHLKIPCAFLARENCCKIYNFRPFVCRHYPLFPVTHDGQIKVGVWCCPAGKELIETMARVFEALEVAGL